MTEVYSICVGFVCYCWHCIKVNATRESDQVCNAVFVWSEKTLLELDDSDAGTAKSMVTTRRLHICIDFCVWFNIFL